MENKPLNTQQKVAEILAGAYKVIPERDALRQMHRRTVNLLLTAMLVAGFLFGAAGVYAKQEYETLLEDRADLAAQNRALLLQLNDVSFRSEPDYNAIVAIVHGEAVRLQRDDELYQAIKSAYDYYTEQNRVTFAAGL